MKAAVIYFSSTGNTAKLATEIMKGLGSTNNWDVDFHRIKKGLEIDFAKYDLIGIGAPAYSFRAPRLMTRMLRKMNFQKKPFFVFATYNSKAGNTLWNLYHFAKKTAGNCLGYFQASITVNIRAWNPKIESDKSLKMMTEKVQKQAINFGKVLNERFQKNIEKNKIQIDELIPPKKFIVRFWSCFLTWDWQMLFTVGLKKVNKERCTQCMLCIDIICPSEAIILSSQNFPRFVERNCIGCNGCVNICPEDAIWTYQTKNRKAYDHYKDYILENLP